MVEVEVRERSFPSFQILTSQGVEEMDVNLKDMLPGLFGGKTKRRRLSVPEAREVLRAEEEARLVDADQGPAESARRRAVRTRERAAASPPRRPRAAPCAAPTRRRRRVRRSSSCRL